MDTNDDLADNMITGEYRKRIRYAESMDSLRSDGNKGAMAAKRKRDRKRHVQQQLFRRAASGVEPDESPRARGPGKDTTRGRRSSRITRCTW
jgi:hypothetical protein